MQLGSYGSSHEKLINSGEIFGTSQAVVMFTKLGAINNTGLIHSGYFAAITVFGEYDGTSNVATQQEIVNSGTITSTGDQSLAINLILTSSLFVLKNTGAITNSSWAIQSSSRSMDRIFNSGTIAGGVDLGGGDDLYVGQGGVLFGALFLGNGSDTADLRDSTLSDYVYGGDGSDVYFLSDSSTAIIESALDVDLVFAECSFRLAPNIENLTLLDGGNFSGFGNAGANTLTGNSADNRLTGRDSLDTVYGDLGNDSVSGGNQDDNLNGDDGNDNLSGGTGTDTLRGGDGDDTLVCGAGRDNLGGATGADVFVLANLDHSGITSVPWDTIVDFMPGDDTIDLSGIDADHGNGKSDDAFAFIGSAAFSNVAGQLRYMQSGANTNVEMDVNGDSVADAVPRLNGLINLNAHDFIM